jgi:uncharacterized membrane protein YdjX (TVP38/TMEM64 family)
MRKDPGRSWLQSPAVRVLLALCAALLIALIFYIYLEGAWRDILHFYKFFFEGKKLRVFLASFGPYSALAFIIVQVLQVVVAPIPGEVTGFVGGLLFGKLYGTGLSMVGLTAGALMAFYLARKLGSGFVRRIVKQEYFDRFDAFMSTHKALNITFILFLIPGFPKDSLCYLLGLTRMKYVDFILMNVFGRLPGTFLLCMQGDAIRNGKFASFWVIFGGSIALSTCLYFGRDAVTGLWSSLRKLLRLKEGQ